MQTAPMPYISDAVGISAHAMDMCSSILSQVARTSSVGRLSTHRGILRHQQYVEAQRLSIGRVFVP